MRRIKEVLRLRYELGLGQRQIARSCSIGQSTVFDYLKRAEAAGFAGRCRTIGMTSGSNGHFSPMVSTSNRRRCVRSRISNRSRNSRFTS